jgi:hypothetical protein
MIGYREFNGWNIQKLRGSWSYITAKEYSSAKPKQSLSVVRLYYA